MTKKIYLETFKNCPGSLCFTLLTYLLYIIASNLLGETISLSCSLFKHHLKSSLTFVYLALKRTPGDNDKGSTSEQMENTNKFLITLLCKKICGN